MVAPAVGSIYLYELLSGNKSRSLCEWQITLVIPIFSLGDQVLEPLCIRNDIVAIILILVHTWRSNWWNLDGYVTLQSLW